MVLDFKHLSFLAFKDNLLYVKLSQIPEATGLHDERQKVFENKAQVLSTNVSSTSHLTVLYLFNGIYAFGYFNR